MLHDGDDNATTIDSNANWKEDLYAMKTLKGTRKAFEAMLMP